MKCLKYNHSISQRRMKTTTCANVIVVFFYWKHILHAISGIESSDLKKGSRA